MNNIQRYSSFDVAADMTDDHTERWCRYSDVETLERRVKKLSADIEDQRNEFKKALLLIQERLEEQHHE